MGHFSVRYTRMTPRGRSAFIPLQAEPASRGLDLRSQIYKACVEAIVDGRLPPGTRLPSARRLATDWRISRNTIDDALGRLQSEGFLIRRVGDGTFVAPDVAARVPRRKPARLRRLSTAGRRALSMVSVSSRTVASSYSPAGTPRPQAFVAGLPDLDLFPFELWRRLVARRMRVSGRALLGYVPTMGDRALREATVRHLAAMRGVAASADEIMILNGSMQALDLIARVLISPGESVWVENPCFPNLRAVLAMAGVRAVAVPVDDDGIDVDSGIRLAPDAAMAYVSPSCQYPTGATLTLERRLALLRWAESRGAWIVEDDYQCELAYEGRPIAPIKSLDRSERVLYVGTFTHSVFPSLRLAYVVLPPPLVAVFQAVRGQLDDHTHGLQQAVLADFLDGGHLSAHLRKMRAVYGARRDALVSACSRELANAAHLGPTKSGMTAALYLERGGSDQAVAAALQRVGVRVLPLSRYGVGPRQRNGLLLGYTALSERRIVAGIAQLARALDRLR